MSLISILHLEDSPLDAELAAARLEKGGLQCQVTRVDTRADFVAALQTGCYDVILSDYALPSFDGASALALAHEMCPNVPFIFLSGKLGEQVAIDTLKQGATDYVLKERMDRLAPAVERALAEARERAKRREMEQALQQRQAEVEQLNVRLRRAMQETHHRVKNNLQVIAAMIDMQTLDDRDTLPVDEFKRLSRQVKTLAVVHDILTREAKVDGQAQTLKARELLEVLIPLFRALAYGQNIALTVNADALLTSRQATSLALALNELIANAIKHGRGDITVTFDVEQGEHASEIQEVVLRIRDHGEGFAPDFTLEAAARTGLELVQSLVKWDLSGSIRYATHAEGGGLVTICFPLTSESVSSPAPPQ